MNLNIILNTEFLSVIIETEAQNEEEALLQAKKLYNDKKIIIDYNNLVELEITHI